MLVLSPLFQRPLHELLAILELPGREVVYRLPDKGSRWPYRRIQSDRRRAVAAPSCGGGPPVTVYMTEQHEQFASHKRIGPRGRDEEPL